MRARKGLFFHGRRKRRHRTRWHCHGFRRGHHRGFSSGKIGILDRVGGVYEDAPIGSLRKSVHVAGYRFPAIKDQVRERDYEAPSGFTVNVDLVRCRECGTCERVCPFDAITVEKEIFRVDTSRCTGCGWCIEKCPQGALSLASDMEVFN